MENHPQLNSNHYSIIDLLESRPFSWIFVADHHDPWRATASWTLFFLLTFVAPLVSHFAFQCSACDYNHRRPFDWIVQVPLSVFSTLSFVSLLRFTRKYGLRRFLFLDELDAVGDKVRRRYSEELHRSTTLLYAFILPCVLADGIYNIWWFTYGGTKIPYFYNVYISHAIACMFHMSSWLYRTSLYLLVCVLFKLTCSLQILRLDDFARVFEKLSDVGPILVEHLTIRRNLRVISHRFRVFILATLILVTASQFASLLVTTVDGSIVDVFTTGELALCSITLVFGMYICQRSAAKITHKAQSLTSLVSKWHICATIDTFVDTDTINESPTANIIIPQMVDLDFDNEVGDGDDELDNTKFIPIYKHAISYQQRQALVTYVENNETGITVYGFMLDRTSINTVFAIQLSLALWLLDKTIGFA
ncbi:hypothetical protein L2E82_31246 [Cichorium intybus]|uniref:Uncharacterized protein n=1 Tax=Cichorium intybus TaxID=13427 RepID=A0ACB9D2S8_CICIN|nr:hypothetical protein L2E82_31246 [Cichorium intybus]